MISSLRLRTALLAATAAVFTTTVLADSPIHPNFDYNNQKVRGVNLGGWLVLEVCAILDICGCAILMLAASRGSRPACLKPLGTLPSSTSAWSSPVLCERMKSHIATHRYTFGKYQSKSQAQSALKAHWDSWITESDFAAIAAAGLNHVRLPVCPILNIA
jgi:glucan 1,3-beta-glucosidase